MLHLPEALPLEGVNKLKDLIGSQRTCMFSETQRDGTLSAKPMTVLDVDEQGALWFMTSLQFLHHADWPANASFLNEGDNTYVSVAGTAHAVQDRKRIHELWSLMCKPWFPQGPDSSDIVLIKLVPAQIEYWDGPSNAVTRGASMLASVIASKPVGMGEHGFIKT